MTIWRTWKIPVLWIKRDNFISFFFSGTHCTVLPEPPDETNLIFIPTEETKHLSLKTDSSAYAPYLPITLVPHGGFGIEKEFIIDGFIKEKIETIPVIRFVDELDYNIVQIKIDVSFTSLVIDSDYTVSDNFQVFS